MANRFALFLLFSLSTLAFETPINFDGYLNRSCSFIDDENVLSTIDSLTQTLNDLRTSKEECKSIYTNSRTFLNSISSEIHSRSLGLQTSTANLETLSAEIFKREQAGTYANEFDYEVIALQRMIQGYQDQQDNKDSHLLSALSLGGTILEDLKNRPACDDNLGNTLLRPGLMLLGQVSGAIYPGSSLITSGVVSGLTSLFDSYLSYSISRADNIESTLEDLVSSTNYYSSFKCAYKNLNVLACGVRENKTTKDQAKKIYKKLISFDTDRNDFQNIADLKKNYTRVQKILTQVRDIYETSQQKETILEITKIQNVQDKLEKKRPKPIGKTEWSEADENITKWENWTMFFKHSGYLAKYINNYCSKHFSEVYNVFEKTCEASRITENSRKSEFLVKAITPAINDLLGELTRLSGKLRESVNVERLYYAVRAEEDFSDRTKRYKLSELLNLYESDLNEVNRPMATQMFSVRIEKAIRAMRTLVEYEGNLVSFDKYEVKSATTPPAQKICSLDELQNCRDFQDVSQAVYTYLASNLSGGNVLSVETIDATFENYLSGVEDYFLNGTEEYSEDYSKYLLYLDMYRGMRKSLLSSDASGASNLPIMERSKTGFEKVFGYEIVKKLDEDTKIALDEGRNSDFYKEAIHACAIFYPLLKNRKEITGNTFKRGKIKKVTKNCDSLLRRNKGLDILEIDGEKFPLSGYKGQCYYRNYEREVAIRQVTIARDYEDDLPDL